MARKITMNGHFRKPLEEVFEDFVVSKIAQGVADVTVATYRHHIHSISNHLDTNHSSNLYCSSVS